MSSDRYYANIAASAIEKNYNNEKISFSNQGWKVDVIKSTDKFLTLKVEFFDMVTYIFCNIYLKEPTDNLEEYFNNINDNNTTTVPEKKGKILLNVWKVYLECQQEYNDFYNEYSNEDIIFTGHGINGSVAGVAAGIFNVNSILFAPIPYMAEKKWLQNHSFDKKPITLVNKNDPYVGNYRQWFQIYWETSKHYFVEYISNGYWVESHSISSYVKYFRNKTYNLC